MIDPITFLQTPAMLLGIAGGILTVSRNRTRRQAGYCSWVVGNSLWLFSGLLISNINLIIQFGFFGIMALQGININRQEAQA